MPSSARHAFPSLLATLLSLTLAVPARAAEPPARALARLESEWRAHLLAERPHEATRRGLPGRDGALVPVTADWLARERAWLDGFGARFAAVATAPLPARRAADRDTLAAWLARARDEHARRAFEREPARYADLAGDAIEDLFRRHKGCGAIPSVTRRLRAVPEVLRAARVLTPAPSPEAAAEGLRRFAGVLELYRVGIPARTADCRDGYAQASLAEADSAAVRALLESIDALRDRIADAGSR